ncbi:MAG: AAA family ATPase, partial [Streptosporangiaceae bacterium]
MTVITGSHPGGMNPPPLRALSPGGSPLVLAPGTGPPRGPAAVRIRLLGRFAVEREGQEIASREFGGRLARRLLRLLALRRGTLVAKDLIAEALWPGDPPADPEGNIEVLVSRIRRALGDRTLIRTGPGGYVLADGGQCWIDAEAFLAAVQCGRAGLAARPGEALASFRVALGIWRGEPLPEDTYADWAQSDRRHLCLAYLEALDGAAAAALEAASAAAAAEAACWARQAVAAEPLRESSVLALVRARAAAGDQAGALAAFEEYRDRLAAGTGLQPTPQACQIRQRIVAGQPAGGQPGPRSAKRPARQQGLPPGRGGPFLGREEECAVIAGAAAGRGPRVVLVTGPSGIGKSALLAGAARQADALVLAVQAFALDQDQAWSLAGRLLSQASKWLPAPVAAILAEPEASALAEVVPGLAAPPGAGPGGVDEHSRRASALQGAVRLVAATARPRCLIVADDLQWADPASLGLLGLLLRRLDGVSLAAAWRPDGANPGFDPAGALGIPATQLTGITLGPLPAGVIRGLFGDQLLAEAILRQAGRTPFTVTEVVAALARRGAIARDGDHRWRLRPGRDAAGAAAVVAAAIEEAAGNRLAGLPSRWRDMLSLLALLG